MSKGWAKCLSPWSTPSRLSLFRSTLTFFSAASGQWAGMHIALVAASAPSHMHPHLAVVRELVQRGHRVSYLVSSHLAELARTTGADVVGCTSVLPGAPGAPTEWPGSGRGGGSGPSRGGHAALPRRGDPRTTQGARGARHRSARHRAVRHRWHGRTRRRRALGCARHPGLAEHGGMGHVSRGHGRSAGADARQPRLPGIPNGLRRLAGTNEHVAALRAGDRRAPSVPGDGSAGHAAARREGRRALPLRGPMHRPAT